MNSMKKALLPSLVALILSGPAMVNAAATPEDTTPTETVDIVDNNLFDAPDTGAAAAQEETATQASTVSDSATTADLADNAQTAVAATIGQADTAEEAGQATNDLMSNVIANTPTGGAVEKSQVITTTVDTAIANVSGDEDKVVAVAENSLDAAVNQGDAEDVRSVVNATVASTASNTSGTGTVDKVVSKTVEKLNSMSNENVAEAVKGLMDASASSNKIDAEKTVASAIANVSDEKKVIVAVAAISTLNKPQQKETAARVAVNAIAEIGKGDNAKDAVAEVVAAASELGLDQGQINQIESAIDGLDLTDEEKAELKAKLKK